MWNQVALSSIKACLPFKRQLRAVARRVRPYASVDPDNDDMALRHGMEIIRQARLAGGGFHRVLEIGTGWIPTIPFLFHAAGAGEVIMTDVEELLDDHTRQSARAFIARNVERISHHLGFPPDFLRTNLERPFNAIYMCPFDRNRVAPGSVDIVYSRTVLEHIPPATLARVLHDGRGYLAPGGLSIHFIDNSDHYQHRDNSLSRLNFLRYPDWVWRVAHLDGQAYQNRLRHSDYLRLFREAGYELLHVEGETDSSSLHDASSMKLAPRFARYAPDDLATLTTLVVARSP